MSVKVACDRSSWFSLVFPGDITFLRALKPHQLLNLSSGQLKDNNE